MFSKIPAAIKEWFKMLKERKNEEVPSYIQSSSPAKGLQTGWLSVRHGTLDKCSEIQMAQA